MSLTKASYSMVNGSPINALDFGADPTGTADSTAAIQNAINSAVSTGNRLRIPAGNYKVTALSYTFTATTSLIIEGDGQQATFLTQTGTSATPVLLLTESSGVSGNIYWEIRDIQIAGNNVTNGSGIYLSGMSRGLIENCYLTTCSYAMYFSGSEQFIVRNTTFKNNFTGVYSTYGSGGVTNVCNLITFDKCTWLSCSAWGVNAYYADGWVLRDCILETCGTSGSSSTGAIRLDVSYGALTGFGNFSMTNCWLEHNYGYPIYIQTEVTYLSTLEFTQLKVVNSYDTFGVYIGGCRSVSLIDCLVFAGTSPYGLLTVTSDCQSCVAINSVFYTFSISAAYQHLENIGSTGTSIVYEINQGGTRTNSSSSTGKSIAINSNGVFFPYAVVTASAPTYTKGGMYFDTTLNKLRIGGASGWETVTSA